MSNTTPHELMLAGGDHLEIRDQDIVAGLNQIFALEVSKEERLRAALMMLALSGNVQHEGEVAQAQPPLAPEPSHQLQVGESRRIPTTMDKAPKAQPPRMPVVPAAEQQTTPEPEPAPSADPSNSSSLISAIPSAAQPVKAERAKPVVTSTDAEAVMGATSIPEPIGRASTARKFITATGVGAMTVTSLMVAASPEHSNAGEISCNDKGHEAIQVGADKGPEISYKDIIRAVADKVSPYEDGRQWSEIAKKLGKEKRYYISAERLAAANKTATHLGNGDPVQLAEYDKDGLVPTLRMVGEYCFSVPGPIVGGQIETDKADTLKLVSSHTNVPVAELRKLNPGLPDDENALLGPGKVVQVAKKLDPSLVLQEADERTLENVADPKSPKAKDVYAKVIEANMPIIARGGDLNSGLRYWPPKPKKPIQKGTPAPAAPIIVEPAPSDFAAKPKPEAKPAPAEQKTLSLEERKKIIEKLALSPEQKAQLTKFVETLAAMPEGETKGVRTDVVLAQAIVSSNWGTSGAAKYNNFFGLQANKDWKGKTAKVVVNDARRDQDQKVVEYRVYDSMADSFKDYVAAIRNSTDFAKHGNDAFVNQAALANLYGGDVLDFRAELLFQLLAHEDFKGAGKLKEFQIAGGIGNFIIESAHTLDPEIEEKISDAELAQKNRGRAVGIVQWQEGRRKALEEYIAKHGNSLVTQGRFIIFELEGSEKIRLAPIMDSKDIEDATIKWCVEYERAGVPHMDKRIKEAYYVQRVHTQAQAHGKLITQTITDNKLAELSGWVAPASQASAPKAQKPNTAQPQGPKVTVKEQSGPIDLKPNEYAKVQRPLPGNGSGGARINADDNPNTGTDGNEVRSSALSTNQRVKIIERELNQAQAVISGERCRQFQINDVSSEVRKKFARNFVGSRTGLGGPKQSSDIEHFIVHFTATNTAANDIDGVTFASSMYHSGVLGVNYHINNKGETSLLTKDFTYHAKNFRGHVYNGHSYGVEVSASEQAEINAEQYEAIVYLAADFLIEQGFVSKDKPVGEAVKRIIGHREANAADGMHHDFPALVMDPIRSMIVNLLVSMGYTR